MTDVKLDRLRKLTEIACRETKRNITIFTNKINNRDKGYENKEYKKGDRKGKDINTETIIIKTGGSSYAQIVKDVRNEVQGKEIGVNIRGIRETKKGDVLITADRRGDVNSLRKAIKDRIGKNKIRATDKLAVIHVRDLDSLTTAEEIQEAAKKAANIEQDDQTITVSSMRLSYGKMQIAHAEGTRSNCKKTMPDGIPASRNH